jgi:MotA/TolQ/ExbB proton channel family
MLIGLLAFGSWLLGTRGVWGLLLSSDPTGITAVIIVVFVGATCWCGSRAIELAKQHKALLNCKGENPSRGDSNDEAQWAADYFRHIQVAPGASDAALDILMSRTHGPHSTAWWVNAIQLKLGLLGKVIGFSILALNIGQLQSFDPTQSQELLKSLTSGLGVALLTTMVGLVGNILLGLQITRLDRFADDLVEQAQSHGLDLLSQGLGQGQGQAK